MNKISTLLVAGSLVAFSAPAMAQDTGSFDGFRIQGVAGYDALKAGSSVDGRRTPGRSMRCGLLMGRSGPAAGTGW